MEYFTDEILLAVKDKKRLDELKRLITSNFNNVILHDAPDLDSALRIFLGNVRIDLVIADSYGNENEAFELLKKIKRIKAKAGVILLSEKITKENGLNALELGAYNLLSLNDSKDGILINIRTYFQGIRNDKLNVEIVQFLDSRKAVYLIPNSLKYVSVVSNHLARDLAQVGLVAENDIENIKFGIQEILINSIEHGNLEITFEQKSDLLKKGYDLSQIIEKYSKLKKYSARRVKIDFTLTREKAEYIISDEGRGFDWKETDKKGSKKNILLEHGRGISMAKKYFDKFYYNSKGNEVTMIIFKKDK